MGLDIWIFGEVRLHNGVCAYGNWQDLQDHDTPSAVREAVCVAATDTGEDAGVVSCGGQAWAWRKTWSLSGVQEVAT